MIEVGTNLSLSPFTHGLVGYWKFDEGTGTNATDSSGMGNNGTLTNGPTWTTGKVGGALSFDGTDDYVNVPDNPSLDMSGNLTIEFWHKWNVFKDYGASVGKGDDGRAWPNSYQVFTYAAPLYI